MGVEYNLVSRDAQRALEEFSQEFDAALTQGAVEQWAKVHGLYRQSKALKTTFPVPVSAAGYNELKGDIKYRDLFEKSLELEPKTWQDGVSALASVVEAPDFIGWTGQPEAFAAAALSLSNEIIAGLLKENPVCWDDEQFFSPTHPVNYFDDGAGMFSNIVTAGSTAPSSENLALAMAHFDGLKGPNGKSLGLRMTHVFHPASQRQQWKQILENDLMIQAIGTGADRAFGSVNNIFKGAVIPVACDELEGDAWYAAALNKPGMYPWVVQDEGSPEEIRSDKDSALYERTTKIGVAYILRGNGALALPHCIQRWGA